MIARETFCEMLLVYIWQLLTHTWREDNNKKKGKEKNRFKKSTKKACAEGSRGARTENREKREKGMYDLDTFFFSSLLSISSFRQRVTTLIGTIHVSLSIVAHDSFEKNDLNYHYFFYRIRPRQICRCRRGKIPDR